MEIFINGKNADITLDTEKNLGDVLSGIEMWISPAKSRIRSISVDGESLFNDALTESFGRDLRNIGKLEITVSSWRELAAEALKALYTSCRLYTDAPFSERSQICADWERSSAARFLAQEIPDLYTLAGKGMSGEGLSASDLAVLTEERLREILEPTEEIFACEPMVQDIAKRMEDFPLDIQTGKDQHAAETLQRFAGIGEKLFRIFFILELEGLSLDNFTIDSVTARVFIDEFNSALSELSASFENKDTVLAGDIAEYELAPRLMKFYYAIKEITESFFPVMQGS